MSKVYIATSASPEPDRPKKEASPYDPYPFDFAPLQRGDVLDVEFIKEKLNIYPEKAPDYDVASQLRDKLIFQTLALAKQIERYFEKMYGDTVTVVSRKGSLVILTADEQDENCITRTQKAVRDFADATRRDLMNDVAALSDQRAGAREERIAHNSWRLLQLRKRKPPTLTDKGKKKD